MTQQLYIESEINHIDPFKQRNLSFDKLNLSLNMIISW